MYRRFNQYALDILLIVLVLIVLALCFSPNFVNYITSLSLVHPINKSLQMITIFSLCF